MPSTELKTRATTVRLPSDVYDEARSTLASRGSSASLNELFVEAISAYLHQQRRTQIDSEFAGMALDMDYQQLCSELAAEFDASDADLAHVL